MGEIKSAIELAMERTQGLRLSHEEMEKLKEEEIQSKAFSLVNRYLEVDFHLREVERELAKYESRQRQQVETLFIQHLCEGMNLDRDNDLILQGLQSFRAAKGSTLQKIKDVIQGYREKKQKEYQNTEKDLRIKLERMGISGSAVKAKVEGSPEWEGALAKFKPAFDEELKNLKKEIRK
jgi:hypothetical protein